MPPHRGRVQPPLALISRDYGKLAGALWPTLPSQFAKLRLRGLRAFREVGYEVIPRRPSSANAFEQRRKLTATGRMCASVRTDGRGSRSAAYKQPHGTKGKGRHGRRGPSRSPTSSEFFRSFRSYFAFTPVLAASSAVLSAVAACGTEPTTPEMSSPAGLGAALVLCAPEGGAA